MMRIFSVLAAIPILFTHSPAALAQSTVRDRFQIEVDCSSVLQSAEAAYAPRSAHPSLIPEERQASQCSTRFSRIASIRKGTVVNEDGDRSDYRWEGFWFGAGAMGLMFGMLVHDACSDSTADRPCFMRTVGGMLMGGAMGGVLGGLIGRTIPKEKREP